MGGSSELLVALQILVQKITDLPDAIITANHIDFENERNQGRTSAFDRPQPVIVMGPNPLPVAGGFGSGPGPAPPKQPPEPKREQTEFEKLLAEFRNDPARRDANARKQLEAAQKAERKEQWDDSVAGRALAPVQRAGGMLAARFAAIAGPAAVIGTILSSSTGGFQTLSRAVQLLGATIAPVLLPAAVLLSAAFVATSDVIGGSLPALEGFFSLILTLGIPVLVTFIDFLQQAAAWAKELPKNESGGVSAGGILDDLLSARLGPAALKAGIGVGIEEGGGSAPERDRARDTVLNALRDVTRSFSLSVGPKAQISGLEGVGKGLQLAALNNDPIEARMLRTQQQIAQMLQRVVDTITAERGVWYPGDGAFGSGAGVDSGGDF